MKVFISWSEKRSKQVAGLLRTWLKCVIQNSEPWASTEDIEAGTWWFTEIGNQLADTSIGVICLTKSNKNNPWILFEAGALTKGLSTSRVIPLLIDLTTTDLVPPLSQLNGVYVTETGIKSLVKAINSSLNDKALPPDVLDQVFGVYWPQFKADFDAIIESTNEDAPAMEVRGTDEILREVLTTVRGFDKRIRDVEQGTGHRVRFAGIKQVPNSQKDQETPYDLVAKSIERYESLAPNATIGVAVYEVVTNFGIQNNLPREYIDGLISRVIEDVKKYAPSLI